MPTWKLGELRFADSIMVKQMKNGPRTPAPHLSPEVEKGLMGPGLALKPKENKKAIPGVSALSAANDSPEPRTFAPETKRGNQSEGLPGCCRQTYHNSEERFYKLKKISSNTTRWYKLRKLGQHCQRHQGRQNLALQVSRVLTPSTYLRLSQQPPYEHEIPWAGLFQLPISGKLLLE